MFVINISAIIAVAMQIRAPGRDEMIVVRDMGANCSKVCFQNWGDKVEKTVSTVVNTAGVRAPLGSVADVVLSAFTPILYGDKIGERLTTLLWPACTPHQHSPLLVYNATDSITPIQWAAFSSPRANSEIRSKT